MKFCETCGQVTEGGANDRPRDPVLSGADHYWYRARTVLIRLFCWLAPIHAGGRIGTTPLVSDWDIFLLVVSMVFCVYALNTLLCEQRPHLVYWNKGEPYRAPPKLWG